MEGWHHGKVSTPSSSPTDVKVVQWLAVNMGVSTFALGALAVPVFGLGFVDALLTIFFINLLGVIPVCFFSIFGPEFGLRQIILSRFFFGYYGVKFCEAPLQYNSELQLTYHQLPSSPSLLVLAGPLSM
jgi:Permease for cytosine/purines, uracil, thiamine, allantoin